MIIQFIRIQIVYATLDLGLNIIFFLILDGLYPSSKNDHALIVIISYIPADIVCGQTSFNYSEGLLLITTPRQQKEIIHKQR